MIRRLPYLLVAVGVVVMVSSGSAQADDVYEVKWSTIDDGGGTSTGDGFRLRGSVGQPDPDTLTGDSFTLRGGFWTTARTPADIPTVSEWGLVVMTLLVLTTGTLVLARRGRVSRVAG